MSLRPLYGHAALRHRLTAAAAEDRLPASLMLQGRRGVGKQRLGLWLGQYLLCERALSERLLEPCGDCQHCRYTGRGIHPDLHWFFPRPRLKDGDAWTYQPPGPHNIAWAFATSGVLEVSGEALKRELAVFEEGNAPLQFTARGDCDFLLGSAVKHPHELVLGPYSVHTSREALAAGMKRITEIGVELKRAG